MHCSYKEASCPHVPQDAACFECERCQKRIFIMRNIAGRIEELARSFPPCAGSPQEREKLAEKAKVEQAQAPAQPKPNTWDPAGAGTQLKKLLAKVGIKSTEGCSCNNRARIMNEKGIEWCEQNVEEIVKWLGEEAGRRKLPFLEFPAKMLVNRAIKLAKKVRDGQSAS